MAAKSLGVGRVGDGAGAAGAGAGAAATGPGAAWTSAPPVGAGAAIPVSAGRLAHPTKIAATMATHAMRRRASNIMILLTVVSRSARERSALENVGLGHRDRLAPPALVTRQPELGPRHMTGARVGSANRERHVLAGREKRP